MIIFGVCFVLYLIKLSAGKGYNYNCNSNYLFCSMIKLEVPKKYPRNRAEIKILILPDWAY